MDDENLMRSECPDCQLQILQHQQGQSASESSVVESTVSAGYNVDERRMPEDNSDAPSSHSQSQSTAVQFPQGNEYHQQSSQSQVVGISPSRMATSSTCQQNVFTSYSKDLCFHPNTLSSHSIPVSSSVSTNEIPMVPVPPVVVASVPGSASHHGCYEGTPSASSTTTNVAAAAATANPSIEPCENYYCSTCSVYDIPNGTNDKFFRTSSTRHPPHVFPPLFYAQGPTSVIPCFSPIPDCTPWGNEYATYAYASASYSQSASVAATTDYYGYAVPTTTVTSGGYEPITSASNYVPTASYSSIQASYCNTTSSTLNEQSLRSDLSEVVVPGSAIDVGVVSNEDIRLKRTDINTAGDDQGSVSIEISSASSLDDSFNSSDDSEIDDISTLSDDRELISVVEEDEDLAGSSLCHESHGILESDSKQSDSSHTCLICLGSMSTLPECTSPQLANILENIDEDITTEDLDISVSSVDIEIGGIEDEMKAFTSLRKKSNLRSEISHGRVIQLLGKGTLKGREYKGHSDENALLCCRCHKLVYLMDSFQKQMASVLAVLNQLIAYDEFPVNSQSPSSSNPKEVDMNSGRVIKISIETQTDDDIEWIRSSNDRVSSTLEPNTIIMTPNNTKKEDNARLEENSFSSTKSTSPSTESKLVSTTDSCIMADAPETQVKEGSDMQRQSNLKLVESSIEERTDYTANDEYEKSVMNKTESSVPVNASINRIKNANECEYCKRKFTTKSYLKSHAKICKFKLSHDSRADETASRDKTGMRCSKCGIGFRNVLRWTRHSEEGCTSTIYECSKCPQRFTRNSELQVHIKVHLKDKSYKCKVCNSAFTTKGNLIAHSITHNNTKKFECSFCHKGFNRRFALTIHENRHKGLKLFRCNMCSKDFADPSNLNNHKKRYHAPISL